MTGIVQIVVACLGSSGLTAIVLALLQRKWACQDRQDAIVAGLKVLTVDRVRYLGRSYILSLIHISHLGERRTHHGI